MLALRQERAPAAVAGLAAAAAGAVPADAAIAAGARWRCSGCARCWGRLHVGCSSCLGSPRRWWRDKRGEQRDGGRQRVAYRSCCCQVVGAAELRRGQQGRHKGRAQGCRVDISGVKAGRRAICLRCRSRLLQLLQLRPWLLRRIASANGRLSCRRCGCRGRGHCRTCTAAGNSAISCWLLFSARAGHCSQAGLAARWHRAASRGLFCPLFILLLLLLLLLFGAGGGCRGYCGMRDASRSILPRDSDCLDGSGFLRCRLLCQQRLLQGGRPSDGDTT